MKLSETHRRHSDEVGGRNWRGERREEKRRALLTVRRVIAQQGLAMMALM